MIAFLINELDICGGTHKQLLKLVEYTATQTDDFFIVTKKLDLNKTYSGFKKYEDKIRIFNPKIQKKNFLNLLRYQNSDIRLLRSLIKDADVVNIHDQGYELYFPAFRNKYVVWQVNDLPTYFRVGCTKSLQSSWKASLLKRLITRYSKYVSKFTVNVSKNRDRIREAFGRDADVLYCGIEPLNITRDIDETFNRFGNNKINILSSGVFFPYRNYETQVKLVRKLVDAGIDVKLNIIGDTNRHLNYSSKIVQMIQEYGLQSHINICGQVSETLFKELHRDSDIFLFINIDQSWGLAVFEAMSCGLPVIVSDSVGATEILESNKNAIFVNPTDVNQILNSVIGLMHSQKDYLVLSLESMHFHQKYTWEVAYSYPMFKLLINE